MKCRVPTAPARLERRAGRQREPQPLRCCPRVFHVPAPIRATRTTDLLRQFFPLPSEISHGSAADPAARCNFSTGCGTPRARPGDNFFFSPLHLSSPTRSPAAAAPTPGGDPLPVGQPGSRGRALPARRPPRPGPAPLRRQPRGSAARGQVCAPRRRPAALTCAFFIRNGSAAVQPSRPCANSLQRNCSSSIMQQPIVHALGLPTASPALPPPVPPPLRAPAAPPPHGLSVRAL